MGPTQEEWGECPGGKLSGHIPVPVVCSIWRPQGLLGSWASPLLGFTPLSLSFLICKVGMMS